MIRRRDISESGAALVEFALILPLFMMLVLGIFSGAVIYNQKMDLTHATREGARYGATVPVNQTFTCSGCTNWALGVRDLVVARSAGDLGGTGTTVCVALVSGASGTPIDANHTTNADGTGCFNDGNTDTGRRVQIASRRPGKLEALVFSQNVNLTANAVARYECQTTSCQ